jgi:hypothetical protein
MLPHVPPAQRRPGDAVSTPSARSIHIVTTGRYTESFARHRRQRRVRGIPAAMWPAWTDQDHYELDNSPAWWPDWTDHERVSIPLTCADILPASDSHPEGGRS